MTKLPRYLADEMNDDEYEDAYGWLVSAEEDPVIFDDDLHDDEVERWSVFHAIGRAMRWLRLWNR